MPWHGERKCTVPHCRERVRYPATVCSAHKKQRYKEADMRREKNPFYGSSQWTKLRAYHLAREPVCRVCGVAANTVDHIVPISKGGSMLDFDNLQSLCESCHNRKTASERRKGGGKS